MKMIIAKKWHEVSRLGSATFTGVPIYVPENYPAKAGTTVIINQKKVLDAAVAGDTARQMAIEIGKKWIIDFVETERPLLSITPDEIYGIRLILNISKTDLARLLSVTKGSITKYIDGSLKPTAPVVRLMLIYLAAELTKPGTAAKILKESGVLIHGLTLTVPPPKFAIKRAA